MRTGSTWVRRLLSTLALTGLAATVGVGLAPGASAHPLGNLTVNHFDGLHLFADHLTDAAVEDVAELPTLQRRPSIDRNGDGRLSNDERTSYAGTQCHAMAGALSIVVGGHRVAMSVERSSYAERPGVISLTVGRLECDLTGRVDLSSTATVQVDSPWDGAGIGWHEISAVATGVSLRASPFPARSISDELRRYPNNLLSSPLDVRSGTITTDPGTGSSTYRIAKDLPVAGVLVRQLNRLATTFNDVVGSKHLTVGVGLLAVLLSVLLGAGHAFLPGHGKTIMAAYLVGRRGRLRDVVTVGATVTVTHTAGVLLLGLAISTTASFAPTQAEQYLGVVSGLIVAGVGVGLLVAAVRKRRRVGIATALRTTPEVDQVVAGLPLDSAAPPAGRLVAGGSAGDVALLAPAHPAHDHGASHDHGAAHDHGSSHVHDAEPHGDPGHRHGLFGRGHQHGHAPLDGGFSKGGLVGLGIAGGLVPSPSALLVLLAATALGRTVFGVVLVLGYGLGMAGALSLAGLLLVRLRGRLDRFAGSPRLARAERLLTFLPVLTALLVLAVGVGLTLRAIGGTV